MLGIRTSEGEKPISLKTYEILANTLFEVGEKRDIFAHLFIFLYWCLTKRSENCVNARINHIHFNGDCLVFELENSNGHKKGEMHLGPWHVFIKIHQNLFVSSAIIITVFVLLS